MEENRFINYYRELTKGTYNVEYEIKSIDNIIGLSNLFLICKKIKTLEINSKFIVINIKCDKRDVEFKLRHG